MSVKCIRCGETMEFDGDDAYVCPDCGAVAWVDKDGGVSFDEESLEYDHVGEYRLCPDCGAEMSAIDNGWECTRLECGKVIFD